MPRTQFMNPSNAYWRPEQMQQTFTKPISGTTGFLINIPYPDPVFTPMGYAGGGSENIYGKRELVFTTLSEMHAVGNVLPFTVGLPRVDPNSFAAKHSREQHTVRV